jgi:uncharacterized protein (TIGR02596 family)
MVMAGRLAAGGRMLIDEITFARQTALSRNLPVELRLYKLPKQDTTTGGPTVWRGFQVFEMGSAGEKAAGNLKLFTAPVIISPDVTQSPMLTMTPKAPTKDVGPFAPASVSYVALRFSPSGMASVTNSNNFATLVLEKGRPLSEGANFVTIQVNPVTGAVRSFRP